MSISKKTTGPTLDITKKPTGAMPFPYLPDERTDDEIEQEKFDKWQQQYEFDNENPKYENNDW